jgi:hypothetical protein
MSCDIIYPEPGRALGLAEPVFPIARHARGT